jgi:type VI secretion system protein ImpC
LIKEIIVEYQVQFGWLNTRPAHKANEQKFRIAVLGDFSARANSGAMETGEGLANRKFLRANHENLDTLLARLNVQLQLPAGASGAVIPVPIRSMDDFHPDQLYTNVPLFEKLQSLRQKLLDPASFEKAAAAVRSLASDPSLGVSAQTSRSNSSQIPRARIDSFADILKSDVRTSEPAEIKTLLRDVVGSHVVPSMTGQADFVAAVDKSLSELMSKLLHHPDFQSLESLWRSLDLLLHRVELDEGVEIVVYDVHAAEFAADIAAHDNLEQSGLYKWLVDEPSMDANQGPFSLILCNFQWEQIPPHADLLGRVAQIAAAAGAPFVSCIDKSTLTKVAPEEMHPLITHSWTALRSIPQASYLALVTPRYMLRHPYGKKSDPIDSFAFEEFTPQSGLKGMLWGNGAFLIGISLAQSFVNDGLKQMKLDSILTIDDLPFYYYNDAYGDQTALPCTERNVNVSAAQHVTAQGFIPLIALKGRQEVRIGGMHSIAGAPISGPWAPKTFEATVAQAEMPASQMGVPADTEAWQPPPAAEPAAEVPAAPEPEDDLDALLASLDSNDSTPTTSESGTGIDPDLEAMLADL